MITDGYVGVIDIGKTNAKFAVVEAGTGRELAVETRRNTVLAGPPWPHFDLDGLWAFFLEAITQTHRRFGLDGLSVTTHGAAAVLLDAEGGLAAPMLDYEHQGIETIAAHYDALRPGFEETGSPRLGVGLNLGAQLDFMLETDRSLRDRVHHVLTYPQYWGYRLTGEMACDVTSLGCHTDLWNPFDKRFSSLPERLGLGDRIAPPKLPGDVLGTVTPAIAAATGLSPETPVSTGIHDSNASLYPYLRTRDEPFAVVSTGTWVVAMAIGGEAVHLDPARDTLVNVNALGQPTPSARFMGGREYEVMIGEGEAVPSEADRNAILQDRIMLLPAVESGSGPYRGRQCRWTREPGNAGQRQVAVSHYLALMTETCLRLVGATGPTIVEGPLARNPDYCEMLAALRPSGVETAQSATGTSAGAALLLSEEATAPVTRSVVPAPDSHLLDHARLWFALVEDGEG
jgi:sugar (pentulose or hexulose) kinase